MNRLFLYLLLACCLISCAAKSDGVQMTATDQQDLRLLKDYISRKAQYDAAKEEHIALLEEELKRSSRRYDVLKLLFNEYKSYNFDRAIVCVERLYDEALALGDKDKIVDAKVQKGFSYLSAGLFKESYDLFEELDTVGTSERTRAEYCMTFARLLYDMAAYNHVGMTHSYNQQGNQLMHEALDFFTPLDTLPYWNCMAIIDQHEGLYDRAITRFKLAMEDSKTTKHDQAINNSTIAYLYQLLGDTESQRHYNILAAINDIESSTKEAVAMRVVADNLNKDGNVRDAGLCIRCAQDDAVFYNARHRQLEISYILPIIEQENIHDLEAQQKEIICLVVAVIVLLSVSLWGLYMVRRRNRKLQQAKKMIDEINRNLLVANRIKEEYIGNFLCWQSDFISEMEKYQHLVKKHAKQRKVEELLEVPKNMDVHRKREDFYKRFDEMFLNIFPNFVKDFNALLRPDEAIELKDGEMLNADLRIFALMRLGITHNEVIAQVLDYSVNTIYSYKTKVKNKSDLEGDQFLEAVMSIPSFKQTESVGADTIMPSAYTS